MLAAAPVLTTYADLTSFPALRLDLAVVLDEAVPAARVLDVVRGAGGDRLGDASVFTMAGSSSARANACWRCISSSVPTTGRSPTPTWPWHARESCAVWPRSSEVSCVASVLVAGASGYAGALAARLVMGHLRLELQVTSRSARPRWRC